MERNKFGACSSDCSLRRARFYDDQPQNGQTLRIPVELVKAILPRKKFEPHVRFVLLKVCSAGPS